MKRFALFALLILASPAVGQGVLEKMQSDLAAHTTQIGQLQIDLKAAQDSLKAAQDALKLAQADIAATKVDVSEAKAEIALLKDRVTALEKLVIPPPPPPPPPSPPPPPPATRATLTANDFTLLGSYNVDPNVAYSNGYRAGDLNYGQGFTHRYVNGKLRFLTYCYQTGNYHLIEFEAPSTFGDIKTATGCWMAQATIGWWNGIWWDEESRRLWQVRGVDYPDASNENNRMALSTVRLNDDGTTSVRRGWWGLTGIPDRRIMGGVCKVPQWFQTQHSVGKYGVGFGGYASRMAANPVSLGLSLYAIGEPETTADNQLLPAFKTLSDHGSGSISIPNPNVDRGVRSLPVTQTYDSWPADRWTWGDTAANTGCWIDNDAGTRNKHGFLIVPTLATGRAWYQNSSLNCEGKGAEIQVFDPAHLAEASKGQRQPWAVQPVAIKNITGDIVGHTAQQWGYLRPGGVEGASFDPLTNRLYVYCTSATTPRLWSHIYVYQVN